MEHFGEHLCLDGYQGDENLLNNKDLVLGSLKELPEVLGMKLLSEPQIIQAPDNGIKDPGGWSAFVIIAESHISIHTFPKRGFISIDVYSCKNGMDVEYIKNYFISRFKLENIESHLVERGTKYPGKNIYE